MATKEATRSYDAPVTESDRHYGYRLGCDGYESKFAVASRVGVSDRTVQRWCEAGLVRFIKLDDDKRGGVRICTRSVTEYLASRERSAAL
jgi:hypothetical protein